MNDLISRQAAIDVAFNTFPDDEYFREQFVKGIEAVPFFNYEVAMEGAKKAWNRRVKDET